MSFLARRFTPVPISSSYKNVASALLTRGRLPVVQLVRFTGLKPRTVRQAILVLIQHNIVWHALTENDGEILEVNTNECLTRLRFGRYVWQAEQLFGHAVCQFLYSSGIDILMIWCRVQKLCR